MNRPNWLLDIPSEEYHKATKDVEYISSHRLSIFRRCPLEYHKHITGEIPEGDTTTFRQGRMAHTLVLEGAEKFSEEYLVASGPVNPKTDAPFGPTSKAYLDWAAAQAKPIVSPDEFAVFGKMSTAVRAHDKAKELLMNSDVSVKEVALTVGISDPNYFTRIFAKYAGMSPVKYRRLMSER